MKDNGLRYGGAGLDKKPLKDLRGADDAEELALFRLKRRLPETEQLPHRNGTPRILTDVSEHYGKNLLEELAKTDTEYAFDEMLLLPDIVNYVALTEKKTDTAETVRAETDALPLSASYAVYSGYFEGKPRAERVWALRRTLELSNRYNVSEREIAESAVNLWKYTGGGDVRFYLSDGVETTMKNALKRKSVPHFVPEREPHYAGKRRETATAVGAFPELVDGIFRFFRENGAERGVIPTVVDLRAKRTLKRTTPCDIAALLFYYVTAQDAGACGKEKFASGVSAALESVARAEKWRGHLPSSMDTDSLQAAEFKYYASHDAAVLVAALRLTAAAAGECGEENLSRRAAQLVSGMDLTVFLDEALGRFSFGYDAAKKRFDSGRYRSQYGRGLLLHLLTNTSLENLEPVVTTESGALETGLFFPLERYYRPGGREGAAPFWQYFLRNIFLGREKKITDSLYASCNWGISESGRLEDLTFRPFSLACILLMCDREKTLARLGLAADGFQRPARFEARETPAGSAPFIEPDSAKAHRVETEKYVLTAMPGGEISLLADNRELCLPLLFLNGVPLSCGVVKYRYTENGAEYIVSGNGVRGKISVSLQDSLRLSGRLAPCGEKPVLTVVLPENCTDLAWEFPTENAGFSPEIQASDRDLLLQTVGFAYRNYGGKADVTQPSFALTGSYRPPLYVEAREGERRRNAPLKALLTAFPARVTERLPEKRRVAAKSGYDTEGNYAMEFTGFAFEHFTHRVPFGKYVAGFSPLYIPDFDLFVYDDKTKRVYSPCYYPYFAEGDYSVTYCARGAAYRLETAGLSLKLTVGQADNGLCFRVKLCNNLPEKRRLSLRAAALGNLSSYGESIFTREIPLAKYAGAEEEFYFQTGAGASYDKPDFYRVLQAGERASYFNFTLRNAGENLPRYLTALGGQLSARQAEAFSLLLCYYDLHLARRLILYAAERQSIDGGFGDYASAAFFPYCVTEYSLCSGDTGILDEVAGYADSGVREEVKYHMLKCMELEPDTRKERLLYVFLLETLLDAGVGADRYRLVRAAEKRRSELTRRSAAFQRDYLEELTLNRDCLPLYRLLSEKLYGSPLSFGESGERDTETALYLFLLLRDAFGLRRRGASVAVLPSDEEWLSGAVLKCRLKSGKADVCYGGDRNTVDGIEVSPGTPVPLEKGRRAVKITVK